MVKGFIVILVIIGKRTISVLDIITDFYYIVKYYFHLFFGGAMRIGSLVQIINAFHPSNKGAIGVIVDTGVHHNGDWKYEILFPSGHKVAWRCYANRFVG